MADGANIFYEDFVDALKDSTFRVVYNPIFIIPPKTLGAPAMYVGKPI